MLRTELWTVCGFENGWFLKGVLEMLWDPTSPEKCGEVKSRAVARHLIFPATAVPCSLLWLADKGHFWGRMFLPTTADVSITNPTYVCALKSSEKSLPVPAQVCPLSSAPWVWQIVLAKQTWERFSLRSSNTICKPARMLTAEQREVSLSVMALLCSCLTCSGPGDGKKKKPKPWKEICHYSAATWIFYYLSTFLKHFRSYCSYFGSTTKMTASFFSLQASSVLSIFATLYVLCPRVLKRFLLIQWGLVLSFTFFTITEWWNQWILFTGWKVPLEII